MLEYIHRSKTAALIPLLHHSRCLMRSAGSEDVARLRRFGETIGWAFQVTDDILDVESLCALGKTRERTWCSKKQPNPAVLRTRALSPRLPNDLATKPLLNSRHTPAAPRAYARSRNSSCFAALDVERLMKPKASRKRLDLLSSSEAAPALLRNQWL